MKSGLKFNATAISISTAMTDDTWRRARKSDVLGHVTARPKGAKKTKYARNPKQVVPGVRRFEDRDSQLGHGEEAKQKRGNKGKLPRDRKAIDAIGKQNEASRHKEIAILKGISKGDPFFTDFANGLGDRVIVRKQRSEHDPCSYKTHPSHYSENQTEAT